MIPIDEYLETFYMVAPNQLLVFRSHCIAHADIYLQAETKSKTEFKRITASNCVKLYLELEC
jgi:hypothetical protein